MIRTTFAHVFHSVSIVGVVLLFVPASQADIIHVPGDQPTIQAGIDAAIDGDEVVLADGTYTGAGNRNLDFGGKAITVRSASGDPELCVIDVEQAGRGFYFHSGEVDDSVVSGITITNGNGESYGGGIYCSGSSPTLINCRIIENAVTGLGGGIYTDHSYPTLMNCVFNNNSAFRGGAGYIFRLRPTFTNCTFHCNSALHCGGVDFERSRARLLNCVFSNNTTEYRGGGIYLNESSVTMTNCEINSNSASEGGGIYSWSSSPLLKNCTFIGNIATDHGGGMYNLSNSNPTLTNCRFLDNEVLTYWWIDCGGGMYNSSNSCPTLTHCQFCGNVVCGSGGGLYNDNSSPVLTNCLFSCNTSMDSGGAMCCVGSNPLLTNCTFAGNWGDMAQASCNRDNSCPVFTNCILWNIDPEMVEITNSNTSSAVVTYSIVRGGTGASWFGEGCLDVDPQFVDWDGPDDNNFAYEDNDYHLTAGSPCIDAGINISVAADTLDLDGDGNVDEPTPFDFVGNHRFADDPNTVDTGNGTAPLVDMGIYEFQMLGDLDWDGDVDLDDFGLLFACLVEPGVMEPPAGVDPLVFGLADLDEDGDVDLKDFCMFQMLYGQ